MHETDLDYFYIHYLVNEELVPELLFTKLKQGAWSWSCRYYYIEVGITLNNLRIAYDF